jgi:hypothetical protein
MPSRSLPLQKVMERVVELKQPVGLRAGRTRANGQAEERQSSDENQQAPEPKRDKHEGRKQFEKAFGQKIGAAVHDHDGVPNPP